MRSFFLTLVFISMAVGTIILYYLVKYNYVRRKRIRLYKRIRKKMFDDERSYAQSRLRHQLNLLHSGEIMWILLTAGRNKDISVELTYSTVNDDIEIRFRNGGEYLNATGIIKKLGAYQCDYQQGLNIIRSPVNAKIVSDILYFVFEHIFNYKPVVNLHLKTSGERYGENSSSFRQ
jgi:hypothetical protein